MVSESLEGAYAWKYLHKIGGTAALTVVALISIQMIVFFK